MPRLCRRKTEVEIKHLVEVDLAYYKERLARDPNDDEALDMVLMLLKSTKESEVESEKI